MARKGREVRRTIDVIKRLELRGRSSVRRTASFFVLAARDLHVDPLRPGPDTRSRVRAGN